MNYTIKSVAPNGQPQPFQQDGKTLYDQNITVTLQIGEDTYFPQSFNVVAKGVDCDNLTGLQVQTEWLKQAQDFVNQIYPNT